MPAVDHDIAPVKIMHACGELLALSAALLLALFTSYSNTPEAIVLDAACICLSRETAGSANKPAGDHNIAPTVKTVQAYGALLALCAVNNCSCCWHCS